MSSLDAKDVALPPSPFVRRVAECIDSRTYPRVIDAGCCQGRNAIYLADCGHIVYAMDKNFDDVSTIKKVQHPNIHRLAGSVTGLPFRRVFDAVLFNEVLHQLSVDDRKIAIAGLKAATKPGGIHAVSGYVSDAKENALRPFELLEMYERDQQWTVIEHKEDMPAYQICADQVLTRSLASIIAIKQ